MDQMRHVAKSNIGNVIRTTTFQGFIGSPFDPSGIYGCKDAWPGKVKTTDETVELVALPLAIGGERPPIAGIRFASDESCRFRSSPGWVLERANLVRIASASAAGKLHVRKNSFPFRPRD